jgi:hypothetical protein
MRSIRAGFVVLLLLLTVGAAAVVAQPATSTYCKLSDLYRAHRTLRKGDFEEILAPLWVPDRIKRVTVSPNGSGRLPVIVLPIRGDDR